MGLADITKYTRNAREKTRCIWARLKNASRVKFNWLNGENYDRSAALEVEPLCFFVLIPRVGYFWLFLRP